MMHVVLGDGEMTRRELSSTLEDLLEKAGEDQFWFLLQAKAEPTATDKAIMEWIAEKGIYYETISDDHKLADAIYKDSQDKHTVKRLAPKVVSLMQEKPDENEEAALFALFVNNDEEVDDDRWLLDVATSVADGGFKVFAMNDGLVELGFDESGEEGEEPEPEEEPEEVAPAPTKAAAKKVAARPAATDDEQEPEEAAELTREALEEMTLPQLKEVAAARGIELPPRTRAQTYIATLLGENEEEPPEAEVEPIEVSGDDDEEIVVEAEAMVLVIFNGTIVTRTMSVDEARELAGV